MRYQDPILRKIKKLMDEQGPKDLRGRWAIGDSMNLPAGALPRGFISYDTELVRDIANTELRDNCSIVITVAVDMKRELQVPTDRSESHEQVVGYLAGKDPDTFQFKRDSIIGVLRGNQDLDIGHNLWIEVGTETEVDYGVGVEKRGPGIVTAEGLIRFQLTHDQLNPEFYN